MDPNWMPLCLPPEQPSITTRNSSSSSGRQKKKKQKKKSAVAECCCRRYFTCISMNGTAAAEQTVGVRRAKRKREMEKPAEKRKETAIKANDANECPMGKIGERRCTDTRDQKKKRGPAQDDCSVCDCERVKAPRLMALIKRK